MRRILVAAIAGVMLSGCVQTIAEGRVRSALIQAGVNDRNADCMAQRMVDRLTIDQLRKLERLRAAPGEASRGLSPAQYLDRVRRVGDSEVIAVTATSAGLCAAGLASEAD